MLAWLERTRKELSPDEAKAAQLMVLSLRACARNKMPLPTLLKGLAEYTEAFQSARRKRVVRAVE